MRDQNSLKRTIDLFHEIFSKALAPIPRTTVSEWADRHRMIPQGSANAGHWRTDQAPYQKEVMNAFTDPCIHEIAAMWAAQGGKSEIMNNVIARFSHVDPCPIMMIQPTLMDGEDYSKRRISPMIRATPILQEIFTPPKARDTNNTILSKFFPGGSLSIAGANSPSALASKPIRILLCDEIDRYPDSAGGEGDPISLAEKRTTTYWNWIVAKFSTPTNKGDSRIEDEYALGTKEEWQHQCPNCKEFHLLDHINMKCDYAQHIDKKKQKHIDVKSVVWVCPDCGFSFDEQTMKRQPQNYVPQNPKAREEGRRSFHVNGFAFPWIGWRTIMREWLEAQDDPEKEKVVYNTRFGLPYETRGVFKSERIFLDRREPYGAELPDGVMVLTAAVDTQDNRLEFEICGWGMGEERYGILKGIILGVPDTKAPWEKLDEILDKEYKFKNGRRLQVIRTFIDSGGHYTDEVYKYCFMHRFQQRYAVKGSSIPGEPLLAKLSKKQMLNSSIPLIIIGTDTGKEAIMSRLSIDVKGPKYMHFPLDSKEAGKNQIEEVVYNRGYDEIYFRGLISEKKVARKKAGRIVWGWENIAKDKRNEPLDLAVYNLANIRSCQVDWEQLQEAFEKGLGTSAPAANAKKPLKVRRYGVRKRGIKGESQ